MRELDDEHRPRSNDPDFWQAWTEPQDQERMVDWQAVADDWVAGAMLGGGDPPSGEATSDPDDPASDAQ
jgi:hypothetical protein